MSSVPTVGEINRLVTENAALREALEWYYEDDKRSVEYGILEDVAKRPAHAVLGKES